MGSNLSKATQQATTGRADPLISRYHQRQIKAEQGVMGERPGPVPTEAPSLPGLGNGSSHHLRALCA